MVVSFIKMQALGNDFVIIDNTKKEYTFSREDKKLICNRTLGVGCDQLIFTEELEPKKLLKIAIFNADGSSASACGNATRCVALQAMKKYQVSEISIKTQNRLLYAKLNNNGQVSINMGKPIFEGSDIPLASYSLNPKHLVFTDLNIDVPGVAVNVGNPHLIFIVKDFSQINLTQIGKSLEHHKYFPDRINVELVKVENQSTIQMQVWERGVGITSACGTGAVAAFAVTRMLKLTNPQNVMVMLSGGILNLNELTDGSILLNGPAHFVFEGKYYLNSSSVC